MKPLPKVVFAGRLCRIRAEGGIEAVLARISEDRTDSTLQLVEGTKWFCFWLAFRHALATGDEPHEDGVFRYPYLCRISDDRYIIASTDSNLVNYFFEKANLINLIDSPRINVDRAARDLVFPPIDPDGKKPGRRYTLGAIYGAVEGYSRALRNVSFFGDDIAEAQLFRYALEQLTVTRLTLRDPSVDKEIISLNSNGGLDFHFRNAAHLNLIDTLTAFFKANSYIEWRTGGIWQAQ
jgi:hypothetical protein